LQKFTKQAAMRLGFVTEGQFDRVVDVAKMVRSQVTGASLTNLHQRQEL